MTDEANNQHSTSMKNIAKALSKEKRIEKTAISFHGEEITLSGKVFGRKSDTELFSIAWVDSGKDQIRVSILLDGSLSISSAWRAAKEYEVTLDSKRVPRLYRDIPAKKISPLFIEQEITDSLFILDQARIVALSIEARKKPMVLDNDFDLISFVANRGFEIDSDDLILDETFYYVKPNKPILGPYALSFNLSILEQKGLLDYEFEQELWEWGGCWNLVTRRWIFGSEILEALAKRGYSQKQLQHLIAYDEELFAGPKSRDQAKYLCDLIARSSFDPGDENEWARYLSFEDATLLGFL